LYEYLAELVSIHDGDTLRMNVDLGFSIHYLTPEVTLPPALRIYGYDAPELGRADGLGEVARAAMVAWFATHGGPYRLHTFKDRGDKYGRILAEAVVASDERELVNDLIVAGWLKPYLGVGPKPVWP
jgi:micrococcal nuclease